MFVWGGRALQSELQATIAFRAYDSEQVYEGGESMKKKDIANIIAKKYFGQQDNPDHLSLVDKFLGGMQEFASLFDQEELPSKTTQTATVPLDGDHPPCCLVLKPTLHCLPNGKKISITLQPGMGGIDRSLLTRKNLKNCEDISAPVLLSKCEDVMKNCKKALSIVLSKDSPFKEGQLPPSGMNYFDYLQYVREKMYIMLKGKPVFVDENEYAVVQQEEDDDDTPTDGGATSTNTEEDNEPDAMPETYIFRGFFAFALWGPIVPEGNDIYKSRALTTGKGPTERGKDGREQSRKRAKKSKDDIRDNDSSGDRGVASSKQVMTMIAADMSSINHERGLQATAHLRMRARRDEIISMNSSISRQWSRITMQRIQDEFHPLMISLSMTESALAEKEEELKILQHKEIARRENVDIGRNVKQQALQEQVQLGLPKSKTPRNSDVSVSQPPSSLNIPCPSSTSTASRAITEPQGESVPV